ncbi:helix-turn-helix domain-containing protein [Microlunatus flavus]|uniref:Cupin domain-containing protein n=1 Tax=Microlunatus flavus TaxID=1036181 RepID=A0A1H9NBU0_9ACTN|nr:XRE family transcriptional regulator [Microlunatus flavus]SER33436.1 Cupin domain-containing protein [Microlunatus flavus]
MTGAGAGEQDLGQAIRTMRQVQGLTLVQLAERAGLSNPFLSQVERSKAQPSMQSLQRIAGALGTTIAVLTASAQAAASGSSVSIVRADDPFVSTHEMGWTRPLVRGARSLNALEFHVTSERYEDRYWRHAVAEFIHVLSGSLLVDLADEGTHALKTGDSLYVPEQLDHRWRIPGRWPARALVVQAGPHDDADLEARADHDPEDTPR